MTALIVISFVVLFILLLLSFSLTVYVKITDEVKVSVGAFGFKKNIDFNDEKKEELEKKKSKQKVKKTKNKKQQTDKKQKAKPREKVNEKTFGETIEFALLIIKSVAKPTKNLLKNVRLTNLHINMTVCDEDANDTALKFGQVCAGVYSLLGYLDQLITVKIKKVNIKPDFVSDEPQYNIYFKVKIRLFHIIGSASGIIYNFIVNTIKANNEVQKQNQIQENDELKKERVMNQKQRNNKR